MKTPLTSAELENLYRQAQAREKARSDQTRFNPSSPNIAIYAPPLIDILLIPVVIPLVIAEGILHSAFLAFLSPIHYLEDMVSSVKGEHSSQYYALLSKRDHRKFVSSSLSSMNDEERAYIDAVEKMQRTLTNGESSEISLAILHRSSEYKKLQEQKAEQNGQSLGSGVSNIASTFSSMAINSMPSSQEAVSFAKGLWSSFGKSSGKP